MVINFAKIKKYKRVLFFALLLLVGSVFYFGVKKQVWRVWAGTQHTMSGYAWTDTIGWISHNSIDTGSLTDYGVNVDTDGYLRGYAWADNAGWVQYDPAGPYPATPNNSVLFDPCTRELSGWAKIISLGNDGWISMKGSLPNYAVSIDQSGFFHGFAWSNVFGWIKFDPAQGGVQTTQTSTNQPPNTPYLMSPINNGETWFDYPSFRSSPLTPVLTWSAFVDPNCGTQQKTYQIQLATDASFTNIIHDAQPVSSVSVSYAVPSGVLQYNNPYQTYYWRVRVQDQGSLWSAWAQSGQLGEPNSFRTPLHAPPIASFDVNPIDVNALVETQFSDTSQTFGNSTIVYWRWDFGDGIIVEGIDPAVHKNPTHIYQEKGQYTIQLKVRDSDNYESQMLLAPTDVQLPLPDWQRTIPR